MNSEQFRLLGIESDYFAADGSFVRVPEEVLASLAAILTAPGQPFFADFDEVFTIAPEMVSLISVGGVLSRCAAAYLLDEKGNSLPYSFVMMEGERIELPPLPAGSDPDGGTGADHTPKSHRCSTSSCASIVS